MNKTNAHEKEILDILHKIDEEKLKELLEEPSDETAEYNEKISMLIDLVESKEESIDARLGLVEFLKSLYKENNTNSAQEQSVELEKEMIAWHKKHFNGKRKWEETSGEYLTRESQLDIARHFAKWQREQMKKALLNWAKLKRFEEIGFAECYQEMIEKINSL